MLQTIREHTQGWIAGTIISIIILTFALWGIHSYFTGEGTDNVIAKVNGTEITKEQLTVAYDRIRRQAQAQRGTTITTKDESILKDRALNALVDIEVLKQASTAQGFRVSNVQIDNYLQSMPEFQVDGQFSVQRFQEILSSTMMSTSEFLDLIKTTLLMDQPKLGIVLTSFSLPDETNYTIALVNQERDINYISIPLSYFLTQPIVISSDKIAAYYQAHQNDFMTPEQVNIEYVQLSLSDLAAKFAPTDAMLKNYYNENINTYTQPMTWTLADVLIPLNATSNPGDIASAQGKAEAVADMLKKGQDITALAKQYSTSNLASKGMLTLNQVPAELQQAVATLTTPNQVSEPIKTSQGYEVLKVVTISEPKIQPFDMVKDKVKETYVRQHAEEKFTEVRDKLADITYEHPESLQLAASTLGLPIVTSEVFTKDKPGKDISQYKKVRDVAFSNDVLNLQNNSDVIQVNPETAIVIRIKSHIPSALLPLKDISNQIEDKLKSQEAEARAQQFAQEFKAKLEAGNDPVALANTYKFTWTKAGYISRYSKNVDPAILDTAFRLANPVMANMKAVYGATRLPNGYAIIALNGVKDGDTSDAKQTNVFAEQVANSDGLLEYELYKLSQTQKAKINVH